MMVVWGFGEELSNLWRMIEVLDRDILLLRSIPRDISGLILIWMRYRYMWFNYINFHSSIKPWVSVNEYKQLETHGYVRNTVANYALLLKLRASSTRCTEQIVFVLGLFHREMLHL